MNANEPPGSEIFIKSGGVYAPLKPGADELKEERVTGNKGVLQRYLYVPPETFSFFRPAGL